MRIGTGTRRRRGRGLSQKEVDELNELFGFCSKTEASKDDMKDEPDHEIFTRTSIKVSKTRLFRFKPFSFRLFTKTSKESKEVSKTA